MVAARDNLRRREQQNVRYVPKEQLPVMEHPCAHLAKLGNMPSITAHPVPSIPTPMHWLLSVSSAGKGKYPVVEQVNVQLAKQGNMRITPRIPVNLALPEQPHED